MGAPKSEYFFAGSTQYLPITITAASLAEATEEWKKVRVSCDQDSTEAPTAEEKPQIITEDI